jgi:hypothetical protein
MYKVTIVDPGKGIEVIKLTQPRIRIESETGNRPGNSIEILIVTNHYGTPEESVEIVAVEGGMEVGTGRSGPIVTVSRRT